MPDFSFGTSIGRGSGEGRPGDSSSTPALSLKDFEDAFPILSCDVALTASTGRSCGGMGRGSGAAAFLSASFAERAEEWIVEAVALVKLAVGTAVALEALRVFMDSLLRALGFLSCWLGGEVVEVTFPLLLEMACDEGCDDWAP